MIAVQLISGTSYIVSKCEFRDFYSALHSSHFINYEQKQKKIVDSVRLWVEEVKKFPEIHLTLYQDILKHCRVERFRGSQHRQLGNF